MTLLLSRKFVTNTHLLSLLSVTHLQIPSLALLLPSHIDVYHMHPAFLVEIWLHPFAILGLHLHLKGLSCSNLDFLFRVGWGESKLGLAAVNQKSSLACIVKSIQFFSRIVNNTYEEDIRKVLWCNWPQYLNIANQPFVSRLNLDLWTDSEPFWIISDASRLEIIVYWPITWKTTDLLFSFFAVPKHSVSYRG